MASVTSHSTTLSAGMVAPTEGPSAPAASPPDTRELTREPSPERLMDLLAARYRRSTGRALWRGMARLLALADELDAVMDEHNAATLEHDSLAETARAFGGLTPPELQEKLDAQEDELRRLERRWESLEARMGGGR